MCICGHLRPSSKSSSGWATSTAAWIPSSTPVTAASSSWPSSGSWGATAISRNAPAGERTTTAPPPSAPLETHGRAQRITPPTGWTGVSAPCRRLPAPAPATWARASLRAQREKRCTFGEPPPQHPPHPTCCLAARQTASREAWEATAERGNGQRGPLEVCFLSPLGTLRTSEGSTGTSSCLMTRCDCRQLLIYRLAEYTLCRFHCTWLVLLHPSVACLQWLVWGADLFIYSSFLCL